MVYAPLIDIVTNGTPVRLRSHKELRMTEPTGIAAAISFCTIYRVRNVVAAVFRVLQRCSAFCSGVPLAYIGPRHS